jgi:hypothetical protein
MRRLVLFMFILILIFFVWMWYQLSIPGEWDLEERGYDSVFIGDAL